MARITDLETGRSFFPMRPVCPVPDASGYEEERRSVGRWCFLLGTAFAAGLGIGAILMLGWTWTH